TTLSEHLSQRTLELIYSRRQCDETHWIVRLPDGSSAIRKSDLLVSILLFIISKSDFLRCCRTGVVFWRSLHPPAAPRPSTNDLCQWTLEIGRASCRERGYMMGVDGVE